VNAEEFVVTSLPRAPCRVLEVGCGDGDLARALAERDYLVTAIDPEAPPGSIFQKVMLEDFDHEDPIRRGGRKPIAAPYPRAQRGPR
jgi:SAM-dependent methyltransferase